MNVEKTIKNLRTRGFQVSHFASGAEAAEYLNGAIKGVSVGIGGSKTIEALGLHKIGHTVVKEDNPGIRGMIFKVKHMVKVEEIAE